MAFLRRVRHEKGSAERRRKIALMEIPALHVRLEFSGYTDAEREAALDLFDFNFQKGGG